MGGTGSNVPQAPTPRNVGPVSVLLEGKCLQQIENVRVALNLSCEQEAFRMLIAIGYEKLKPVIDKE